MKSKNFSITRGHKFHLLFIQKDVAPSPAASGHISQQFIVYSKQGPFRGGNLLPGIKIEKKNAERAKRTT